MFGSVACGGASDLVFHHQIEAGLARVIAAANEEAQIIVRDREFRRGKRAFGFVAVGKRVHETAPSKTVDGLLAADFSMRRRHSKCVSRGAPIFVIVAFEVCEKFSLGNKFGLRLRKRWIEREPLAIEVAEKILATGTARGRTRTDVNDQRPLLPVPVRKDLLFDGDRE